MMSRRITIGLVLFVLAWTARAADKADKKEPFYRHYLIAGDPLDERILAQEKRVDADPGSAALRNDFGNLLAARRFPADARVQYKTAMDLDKKYFLAPYNLGLLEETEGHAGAAISAYQESIKRKPGFPPSHFRLARLYERRGSTDLAIEHYARSLRIDRSMRDPRRNPLVADTQLLDRVSLSNYDRDMAVASMPRDEGWAEASRFAQTPVDRTLNADEAAAAPAEEPPAAAPAVTVQAPTGNRAPPPPGPTPRPGRSGASGPGGTGAGAGPAASGPGTPATGPGSGYGRPAPAPPPVPTPPG
jgi:tetratricopeptide (TPR) repeat protein